MPLTHSDEWGADVARRNSTIGDLIAAEARYHHTECYIPFTNNRVKPGSNSRESIGRPSLLHDTEHFRRTYGMPKEGNFMEEVYNVKTLKTL